jgi:hypothetical protein
MQHVVAPGGADALLWWLAALGRRSARAAATGLLLLRVSPRLPQHAALHCISGACMAVLCATHVPATDGAELFLLGLCNARTHAGTARQQLVL